MKKRGLLTVLAVAAVAPLALADSLGPINLFNGVNFDGTYKTSPLSSTHLFSVPLGYHATTILPGFSGAVFTVAWDTSEVNFSGVAPGGIVGQATTLAIVPTTSGFYSIGLFNMWNLRAATTGTTIMPSVVNPFGTLIFHATGTTPANNSDLDIFFGTFLFTSHTTLSGVNGPWMFPIFHMDGPTTVQLEPSDWVYINGTGDPFAPPPPPGGGVWAHVTQPFTQALQRSNFVGTTGFLTAAGAVGVEHVPEPTTGVALLLGGVAALVVARRRSIG